MSRNPWYSSLLALGALTLALALGSCGKVADRNQLQLDSNTNWLVSCEADQECSGSLRCYCGQCTQPCALDDQCSRLSGAVCAESGEAICGQQASAGGLCVLDCRQDDDCGSNFSCNAGQCVPVPAALPDPTRCSAGTFLDWDQLYALVASDAGRQDTQDLPFYRYVSLGDRYLESDCSSTVTTERQGLSKVLNSLSLNSSITQPLAIDAGERLYRIDLRDYDWDRPITLGGTQYNDGWEALVASNPYAVPFIGDAADDVSADTGTRVPLMLAGPLIALASEPEVYYALLEIPEDISQLWVELGIDQAGLPEFQAGFVDGSELFVNGSEFLAQQWQSEVRSGYLWQISEFGRPLGSLFEDPLAPPLGEQELIFTLPNGLHAFAFADSDGRRLSGRQGIIDPIERIGAATAPRWGLRRHAYRVNVSDEVLDYVLANPGIFPIDTSSTIRQRFPGNAELVLRLERDYESFALPALRRAGIEPTLVEPITSVWSDFDKDVTLDRAASELLVLPADLRDNLELLAPVMSVLDGGGRLDRGDFSELYLESLCILGVVLENQVDPAECDGI